MRSLCAISCRRGSDNFALVVRATSPYSDDRAIAALRNGCKAGSYGEIHLPVASTLDVKFSLVDSATGAPVTGSGCAPAWMVRVSKPYSYGALRRLFSLMICVPVPVSYTR